MASVDLIPDELIQTIYDETVHAFNGLKSATEQSIQESTDEAKQVFDNLISQAANAYEELWKSTDMEAKKDLTSVVTNYTQNISDTEKETIQSITHTWCNTKAQLHEALEGAKSIIGKHVKELEKILKEIIKYMDKAIADYSKLIHELAKATQTRLIEMNHEYLKK